MIVKYFCLGFTNTYNWKILHLKTHHISESKRARAKQPPAEEEPHTDTCEANSCSAQHAARRGCTPLPGEPGKERAKRKVRPAAFRTRTALQPGNKKAAHFRGHLRANPALPPRPFIYMAPPPPRGTPGTALRQGGSRGGPWFAPPPRAPPLPGGCGRSYRRPPARKRARASAPAAVTKETHISLPPRLCSQSPGFLLSLSSIKEGRECGGKRRV